MSGRRRSAAMILIAMAMLPSVWGMGCSDSGDQPEIQPTRDTVIEPIDTPSLPERGFFKGILPLPGDGQDLDESYAEAARYAEWSPVWASGIGASDFREFAESLAGWGGETFVEGLIRGNGMFPIIQFSFIDKNAATGDLILATPDDLQGATLSDPEWRSAYSQAVLDAVRASRPRYLSVGNEVNRWYEQYGPNGPNGFRHFVTLYEEIYDSVQEISPQTNVFCVFSREIVDELREADLTVLSLFNPDKLDVLVFTSYPHSVKKDSRGNMLATPINRPSDIPDNYYSSVFETIEAPGKPFGFSEIAWPSTDAFGGEQAQAAFITEATGRLTGDQGINLHLYGWPWLHDLGPDDDTGLIKRDGTPKAAHQMWKNL